MPYKKTNEAWFGDTFDRDSIQAYTVASSADVADSIAYAIKGLNNNSATLTCNGITINDGLLDELSGGAVTSKISIAVTKDELEDKISEIKARIDALEQTISTKKSSSDLRSALKTLNYKREI